MADTRISPFDLDRHRRLFGRDVSTRWLVIFGLLAAFVFGLLKLWSEISEGDLRAFDRAILLFWRSPADVATMIGPGWLKQAMIDFTALGGTVVLTLVIIGATAFALLKRAWRTALLILGASMSGAALIGLLKNDFARARPDLVEHYATVTSHSFPSGHSANSAIVYLTIAVLLSRLDGKRSTRIFLTGAALTLTFLVGLSRVALGVHWPTDVIGGWLIGIAWATLWALLVRTHIADAGPLPQDAVVPDKG